MDVEPSNGPEASYAVHVEGALRAASTSSTTTTPTTLREVIADKPAYRTGCNRRVDSLGHFVFKYIDDHGRTWSAQRYDIPQRDFEIDRKNPYGGKLKFFWNVGKAFYLQRRGLRAAAQGRRLRRGLLHVERRRAAAKRQHSDRAGSGEDDVGDAAGRRRSALRTPKGGGPIAEEQSYLRS